MTSRILSCLFLILSLAFVSIAPASEPVEPAEPAGAADNTPLYALDNTTLLERFQNEVTRIENGLFAALRRVAQQRILYEQAAAASEAMQPALMSAATAGDEEADPQAADKIALDAAEARLEALKNYQQQLETEKERLDEYSHTLNEVYSDTQGFAFDLHNLFLFALQVKLRLEDRTLTKNQVPKSLTEAGVTALQKQLQTRQQALEQIQQANQAVVETMTERLAKAGDGVVEAEADYQSAKDKYAYELKRHELQRQYAAQSPRQVATELAGLEEERSWLNSALNVSIYKFNAAKEKTTAISQALEADTPPETANVQEVRPEEALEATKHFKSLEAYHTQRLAKLEAQRQALEAQIQQGEVLAGDLTVLIEQISKMQVIAGVLEGFVGEESQTVLAGLPPETRLQALSEEENRLSEISAGTAAAINSADKARAKLEDKRQASLGTIKNIQHTLVNLQKNYETFKQTRQWEKTVKDLATDALLANYQKSAAALTEATTGLESRRAEFTRVDVVAVEEKDQLDALLEPILREVRQSTPNEEHRIAERLYQYAGMEPPSHPQATEVPPPSPKAGTDTETQAEASNETEAGETPAEERKEASPPALITATKDYQHIISARLRIEEERNTQKAKVLAALEKLNQVMETYLNDLTETIKQAQQHHATAVELKKRVGRGEVEIAAIPADLTQALNRSLISTLESEIAERVNHQRHLHQDLETLKEVNPHTEEIRAVLVDVQILVGKHLDTHQEIQKLKHNYDREQDALSATELKTRQQAALRRLKFEDSVTEVFLDFFKSEEVGNLTELMQAYYLELNDLETKQQNLTVQQEKMEKIVSYLDAETPLLTKLQPMWEDHVSQVEQLLEEEELKIHMQLVPSKTDVLLARFEAETGRSITPPPPVTEADRVEAITKAAGLLYDLQSHKQALNKWQALMAERLSDNGIDMEIGSYQDQIANLTDKFATLTRRVESLKGHSPAKVAELTEEELPTTKIAWRRFSDGEIGVLRADRLQLYKEIAILTGIQLAAILVAALLSISILGSLLNRILKRAQRKAETGDTQDNITVSLLFLLKKGLSFMIWVIAFILILDVLGFEVGAILAGLGIGGLAIAMAAKGLLADIFGGISIMLTRLFKLGDLIEFKGKAYKVQDIGLRYTVLQDFSYNYKVNVPNALLVENEAVTISSHPGAVILTNIRLSTNNPAEKVQQALTLITDVVNANPAAKLSWVKHDTFDDYSFGLRLNYNILQFKDRIKVETEVNVEIVRRLQQQGIEFTPLPGTRT